MRIVFALIAAMGIATASHATIRSDLKWTNKGMMAVNGGREFYYEHKKAAPGRPTFVLINGLTWSTRDWDKFSDALYEADSGVGIVRIDMQGMGQTLLSSLDRLYDDIPAKQQAQDVMTLVRKLKIAGPKISVGLSYGGAIALLADLKSPGFFDQTVAIAPFLEPIPAQDQWIRMQIAATRLTFPLNPASDDELYDYFLKQLIYQTYGIAEPAILSNPWNLEGVYRMVKGIRKEHAVTYVDRLPRTRKIHFVQPTADEYVEQDAYNAFWEALAPEQRASRLLLEKSKHKMPETEPVALAQWVLKVSRMESGMNDGKTFSHKPGDFKCTAIFR